MQNKAKRTKAIQISLGFGTSGQDGRWELAAHWQVWAAQSPQHITPHPHHAPPIKVGVRGNSKFQTFRKSLKQQVSKSPSFKMSKIQKIIHALLIDIDPISKFSNTLLDSSLGFVGPRLFHTFQKCAVPRFEMSEIKIMLK